MTSSKLLKTGVLLIAVGLAFSGYTYFRSDDNCQGQSNCAANLIELLGNVDVRQVNLAFKVPGRLQMVHVEEGDHVKKGEQIAQLELADFEDDRQLAAANLAVAAANLKRLENGTRPEEIQQAKARVAERKATVENAVRNLKRREELADQGFTAHEAHEDAAAFLSEAKARLYSAEQALALAIAGPRVEDIEAARAQRLAASMSLALAQRRQIDATIIAPNAGMVLTRVREPGAIVAAGEPILNLSLSTPVWVRAYIEEPDLGRITGGMKATVTTDAGRSYIGQVGFISPVAEFTPKAVETKSLRTSLVYRIRIIVENPDDGLKQGMPVTVQLALNGSS